MRIDITAIIRFPSAAPVEGHFASIGKLHELGYLDRDGDYLRSLERAGFHIVENLPERHLDIAPVCRGVFARGVGAEAEGLLSALASEGFEGVVRDGSEGRSWYLSGGRFLCLADQIKMAA
jgi:hypothetical protein|nr:hypothetical protein [Neorhizobium tomejilense]